MERLLASLAIWAVAAGAAEGPNLSTSKFERGVAAVDGHRREALVGEPPVGRVSGGSLRSTPATRVRQMANLELLNLVGNGSFEADAQRDGVPDGWRASGSHIVIYVVAKQGIDVGTDKHAVVCSKHATICGGTSIPRARALMKYPEFCEACMESDPNI